jgi:hypothetical protein
VAAVDQSDDAVEAEVALHVLIDEECLRNRPRVGEAGGFDDDAVELVATLHQVAQDADQVAAHGAADAPVVHLEDLFVGIDDEGLIDADLTELVLDHGDALAVVLGEDAIEKGGLARPEKPGEDRDRNALVIHRFSPSSRETLSSSSR